jgi:hypothetical protein
VSLIDAAALARVDPNGGKREPSKNGWDAANALDEWQDMEALRKAVTGLVQRFEGTDEGAGAGRAGMPKKPKQADVLIALVQRGAELFHGPDRTGFADIDVNGHRETWPIRSKGFRRWLARRFYETTKSAPSSEALQSALNVIEAKANFDAPERIVHVRVAGLDGKLYLDLGDEKWRAVEIDAFGWRVIDNSPVRFRRASGMQSLPIPASGGSIGVLRPFLNVRSDSDFVLVVSWALAVLRNRGPYPVIVLSGEQGSAKSTFSAILRALLDPNTAPLRALPREDRDLFIAASNGHLLAFDNVSGLPAWISDTLCRLATGGGFAVRQLYTDQDEILFDAMRPVILNGIEDVVTRPDLADRAIFLSLKPIPETQRRPEAELWAAFEIERPRILGALLDAMVEGLKRLPGTRLPGLPRMADFALWATACETAIWPAHTFWTAYCDNRDEAVQDVLEADPVASAVRAMIKERTEWMGTASALLGVLADIAGERVARAKTWPNGGRALSGRLRRAATFLRKIGIKISFEREDDRVRTRFIRIIAVADAADGDRSEVSGRPFADGEANAVSADRAPETARVFASASSATKSTFGSVNDLPPDANADGKSGADANADANLRRRDSSVRTNPLNSRDTGDPDAADAKIPAHAARWSGRL